MNFKGNSAESILRRLVERTVVEDGTGCWLVFPMKGNYSRITISSEEYLIHRISWEINRGEIPDDKWVLHKCIGHGNCWNPDHLYLGTPKQNAEDRDRQGRRVDHPGESNGMSKLTPELVIQIRNKIPGDSVWRVGERYGISGQHVSDIRNRKCWAHLP